MFRYLGSLIAIKSLKASLNKLEESVIEGSPDINELSKASAQASELVFILAQELEAARKEKEETFEQGFVPHVPEENTAHHRR